MCPMKPKRNIWFQKQAASILPDLLAEAQQKKGTDLKEEVGSDGRLKI